jgi:hypothetical protein
MFAFAHRRHTDLEGKKRWNYVILRLVKADMRNFYILLFAGLLASRQYAFGRSYDRPSWHRFSWFSSVFKQMLRWLPSSKLLLHASYAAPWLQLIKITLCCGGHQIIYLSKLSTRKSKFRCLSKVTTSHRPNVFSFILSYQKDERAKPGGLQTTWYSFFPPNYSVSHFSPMIFLHLLFYYPS